MHVFIKPVAFACELCIVVILVVFFKRVPAGSVGDARGSVRISACV
jgi:hypothetical protein